MPKRSRIAILTAIDAYEYNVYKTNLRRTIDNLPIILYGWCINDFMNIPDLKIKLTHGRYQTSINHTSIINLQRYEIELYLKNEDIYMVEDIDG